jgi:HIP---CoA ligase
VPATIAALLAAAARADADGIAIRYPGRTLTFAELEAEARTAASGLITLGARPRDRVAVWAPNTLDAAIALLAVLLAGGIAVPVNTRYRPREVREILRQADCALLLAPARFLDRDYAAEAAELIGGTRVVAFEPVVVFENAAEVGPVPFPPAVTPWSAVLAAGRAAGQAALADRIAAQTGDDVAVIQYTSGTTGRPKGAALRQGPLLASAAAWSRIVGLEPGAAFPVAYPLAHVGGFKTGLLTALVAGAAAALCPVIDAESVIGLVAGLRPDVLSAPPPVLRSLLAAAEAGQLSPSTRVRTVVTGSAIVPPSLVRALAEAFGTKDVIIGYGLTEATGVVAMTRRGDPIERVCDSIGCPVPGLEVRVVPALAAATPARANGAEVGELQVRGPNVMAGYWRDPAATAEVMDGDWLRTGDLGWIGPDGYAHIVGRARELLIVGGFNVHPAEVEQILDGHPDVAEAAVVGVPDERLGEVAAAYVVPAPGAAPTEDALISWCRQQLANYKVPRHVLLVSALPRGAGGKVAKAELAKRARTELGRS